MHGSVCEYVEFFKKFVMIVILKAYPYSVALSSTHFLYIVWSEKLLITILDMSWHHMSYTAEMC